MNDLFKKLDDWLNNRNCSLLEISNKKLNIKTYNIEKDLFFSKSKAIENVFYIFLNSYLINIQNYLKNFDSNFSFYSYLNFSDFEKRNNNEDIKDFLIWMQEENLFEISKLMSQEKENLDPKKIMDIVKYNEFLVKTSFETENLEAVCDFLMESVNSILNKISMILNMENCQQEEIYISKHYDANISINLKTWFNLNAEDVFDCFLFKDSLYLHNKDMKNQKNCFRSSFFYV